VNRMIRKEHDRILCYRRIFFSLFIVLFFIPLMTSPSGAAEPELILEDAKLTRVIPGTGNNPFNVNDPTAGGSTIGDTRGRRVNPLASPPGNHPPGPGSDAIPPVVTPPAPITVQALAGSSSVPATNASIQAFLQGARALDNADGVIANITNNAPVLFPVGITIVTFSARDKAGNAGTAISSVTVNPTQPVDTAPPVVTAPPPISVTIRKGATLPSNSSNIGPWMRGARAVDNVDGVIPQANITNNAPTRFPVGATIVTFSARDKAGNIGTATSTMTVVADTTAPVVTPPAPIILPLPSAKKSDPAIVAFLNGVRAFDNVDGAILPSSITNNAPATFFAGTRVVTFTAHDASGNVGTAVSTVTVQ